MDFDTSKKDRRSSSRGGSSPKSSTASASRPGRGFDTARGQHPLPNEGEKSEEFRIPAGARKAALVHLALEVWRKGLLDPKALGEVRGRDVDEAGLQRALYRSSMGEIEHILGPLLMGRRVIVEGRLAGTGRTAIERLGAEVEELRLVEEKRYVDMTPAIFVFAAVAMAVRYVSLGLDDQDLYILAGILFALMYGLRPFFFKMQRPKDE